MGLDFSINNFTGFEWDVGNINKNFLKHSITIYESEEVFFNEPLVVYVDEKHSLLENRYFALGISNTGKQLLIVFTTRREFIRVISARPMSKKERIIYEKASKKDSSV